MITINQGDSSNIIVIECESQIDISDGWYAELVIVSAENKMRPIIKKTFAKNIEENYFYNMLMPSDTIKLKPGRYILSYQISNESLCFRKEIKESLKINQQYVWNSNDFGGEIPGHCIYTVNGEIPASNQIVIEGKK